MVANDEGKQFEEEYKEFLKSSVEDGTYFKDALSWFAIKYITPMTERMFLTIISITAVVIMYLSITMIIDVASLNEQVPVILREKDATKYIPIIKKLKTENDVTTPNEAVAKYLIINYMKEREEHYYPTGDLNEYNLKFTRIQNNSLSSVFTDFKNFMSKTNPESPIHFFGKDVKREIEVESFRFVRMEKNFWRKTKDLFGKEIVPNEVDVKFTISIITPTRTTKEERNAKISFDFNGIDVNSEGKYLPLKFMVTSYKTY